MGGVFSFVGGEGGIRGRLGKLWVRLAAANGDAPGCEYWGTGDFWNNTEFCGGGLGCTGELIGTAALGVRDGDGALTVDAATAASSFAWIRAISRHAMNSCFFVAVNSLICCCIAFRCCSTADSSASCI